MVRGGDQRDFRILGRNGVYGLCRDFGFCDGFRIACLPWPNVEAAVIEIANLPRSPNTFAFAKAAIENIMGIDVTLGPMGFGSLGIVATFDEKTAEVIIAITAHHAVGEREVKLHPVTIAGLIVVKANPGPGGIKLVAHANNLTALIADRQSARLQRAELRTVRFRLVWLSADVCL
jgi:hypothetical protein